MCDVGGVDLHIATLSPVAQRVVHQDQGQHGLGDRRGTNAHTGVVTTKGLDLGGVAICVDRGRGTRIELVGLMAIDTRTS